MSEDTRPTVAVFRLQLFKRTETFIAAQGESLRRWRPLYLGRRLYGPPPPGAETVTPLTRAERLRVALLAAPAPFVRALEGRRVDLLHAHFGVDALYAGPLARRLGCPLVVTLHGFDVSRKRLSLLFSGRPALMRAALGWKRLAEGADRVLAVSEAVADVARRRGVPPARLVAHPIGVDCARLRPTGEGEPGLVVQVGRLVEKKGAGDLIEAFAAAARDQPDARLLLIGEGPLRSRLEQRARRTGLEDRIAFMGALPHVDTLGWIARAEVMAVPSRVARDGDAEGLPTVLLEAAALGRAIVASDTGGVAEAVRHQESALVVPPGDREALAAALRRLLGDGDLRRRLGTEARRTVEARFDLAVRTAALEETYDAVLAERSATGGR